MNEKISHSFLDAFISMDNACKDALKSNKNLENLSFSGNGGVTVYINQLVELRFAPERNEVLQRLVKYRKIRNRLVHEKNARDNVEISKKDIFWINKFERRLTRGRDPISIYLRNEKIYRIWSKVRFIFYSFLVVAVALLSYFFLKKLQII